MPRSWASCAYRKISIRKYDHRLWHVKSTATQSWTIGHRIFFQTCLFFCLLGEKNFDPILFKCISLRSQTPFIPFILWKSAKDPGFLQISVPFLISCIKWDMTHGQDGVLQLLNCTENQPICCRSKLLEGRKSNGVRSIVSLCLFTFYWESLFCILIE